MFYTNIQAQILEPYQPKTKNKDISQTTFCNLSKNQSRQKALFGDFYKFVT